MPGTLLTSGFDAVLQINARNLEIFIERRLAPLFNLLRTLSLRDAAGSEIGSLTFEGTPSVRLYLAGRTGMQFDLELVFENAVYALTGRTPVSLGAGRSTLSIPVTLVRTEGPGPRPGMQSVDLSVDPGWTSTTLAPFDDDDLTAAGITASYAAASIAAGVRTLLPGPSISLTQPPVPVTIDGSAAPPGMLVLRDLQFRILRTTASSMNVDSFAVGLTFRNSVAGNASTLVPGTQPLDEGILAISNGFLFDQIIEALAKDPPQGLGIDAGALTTTPAGAPDTLAITPRTRTTINGNQVIIENFALVASSSTLTLTSRFQFTLPPGVDFHVDVNGPVTFALARGGRLVAGAVLTNTVTFHINMVGGVLLVFAAMLGAIITVASAGTAAAPVAAIGAATVASAVIVAGAFITVLVGEIGRLLGPVFQTSIEAAFTGAGGGFLPPGLLSMFGGSMSFTPPLIFDDLNIGVALPGFSSVPELRRVDAVAIEAASGFDLDRHSGVTGSAIANATGLDLLWASDGYPMLHAAAGARIIRLAGDFDSVSEPQLEMQVIGVSQSIDGASIPLVTAAGEVPDAVVIGVRTSEHRYAKAALWQDERGRLIVRYVLYDNLAASVRIQRPTPVWQVIRSVRDADTPGTWLEPPRHNYRVSNQGGFRAACHRTIAPMRYAWTLDGIALNGAGSATIGSAPVTFEAHGDSCIVTTAVGASLDAELTCSVRDAAGNELTDRMRLVAAGTRSIPFGRSALQSRIDSLGQLVITRIEDIRPYPLPEELLRIETGRLVAVSSLSRQSITGATKRPAALVNLQLR